MMKLLMKACLVMSCLVFGSLVQDFKKVEAQPAPPPASCPSELAPSARALVTNGCVITNSSGQLEFDTTPTTDCCGALKTFLDVANGTSCECIVPTFTSETGGLVLSIPTNNMIAGAVINCTIPIIAIKPIDLCIVPAPPPPTP